MSHSIFGFPQPPRPRRQDRRIPGLYPLDQNFFSGMVAW